jgi:ankyrin repeat protein
LAMIAAEYKQPKVLQTLFWREDIPWVDDHSKRHILYHAVLGGDFTCIDIVLERMGSLGLDINLALDDKGTRAGHVAMRLNDLSLLEHLHRRGIQFTAPDNEGVCPYDLGLKNEHNAFETFVLDSKNRFKLPKRAWRSVVEGDKSRILKLLFAEGLSPHDIDPESGEMPLTYALKNLSSNALYECLEKGVPCDQRNGLGHTLLETAIMMDAYQPLTLCLTVYREFLTPPIIESLILKGVESGAVECIRYVLDTFPELISTAFQESLATRVADQPDMVCMLDPGNWLVLKIKFMGAVILDDQVELYHLIDTVFRVDRRYLFLTDFETPLHYVSKKHKFNTLLALLNRYPVSPNILDTNGHTIAHHIATHPDNLSTPELWEKLDWSLFCSHGHSPLAAAMWHESERLLDYLFKHMADRLPEIVDSTGNTLLHVAAGKNKLAYVKSALAKGISPNVKNYLEGTPCLIAVQKGRREMVQLLLTNGANLRETNPETGNSLLHIALDEGHEEVALLLIAAGVSRDAKNKKGQTPMHLAAKRGFGGIVRMLAGPDTKFEKTDNEGYLPLHYAIESGKTEVIPFVLHKQSFLNKPVVDPPTATNRFGHYPMQLAALAGKNKMLHYLFGKGARADLKNKYNYNVGPALAYMGNLEEYQKFWDICGIRDHDQLAMAAAFATMNGHLPIIDFLYAKGIPVEMLIYANIPTPWLAAKHGYTQILRRFLANPIPGLKHLEKGSHAIEIAIKNGHLSCARLLAQKYPHLLEMRNLEGESLLHLACQRDHLPTLGWLVRQGLSLTPRDSMNDTPLQTAARWKSQKAFQFLLIMGADHTALSAENKTALGLVDHLPDLYPVYQRIQDTILAQSSRSPYVRAIALHDFHMLRFLKSFVPISFADRELVITTLQDTKKTNFIQDLPAASDGI